jgi:hypothetical protein
MLALIIYCNNTVMEMKKTERKEERKKERKKERRKERKKEGKEERKFDFCSVGH